MEVESVKREKEADDIDLMIGASIFKAKENEVKEKIRELVDDMEEKNISLEEVRKITSVIKGSLSEAIIEERERT